MTDSAAPGWYPDPTPALEGDQRYWDGTTWTAHVHSPSGVAEPLPADEASAVHEPAPVEEPAVAAAPAGWYPNPEVPGQQRYWDGSAWTDEVKGGEPAATEPAATEPAATEPAYAPVPPPYLPSPPAYAPEPANAQGAPRSKKRKRRRLAAVSAVLVAVLVAGGIGVVKFTDILDGDKALAECSTLFEVPALEGPLEELTTSDLICTDSRNGFDYTAPATGLTQRDVIFTFPAKLSHQRLTQNMNSTETFTFGFKVFADEALTVELPIVVGDNEAGDGWLIESAEAPLVQANYPIEYLREHGGIEDSELLPVRENYDTEDIEGTTYTLQNQWGFRDDYYMVRYVDEEGEALERPVVSKFGFEHQLDTPNVTYGDDPDSPGTIQLTWGEVKGADRYLIIKGYNMLNEDGEESGLRYYQVIGHTSDTSWSALEAYYGFLGESWQEHYRTMQNYSLELFDTSDDSVSSRPAGAPGSWVDFEIGVIAIADAEGEDVIASAFSPKDGANMMAGRAHEIAENTWFETYGGDPVLGTEFPSFDEIPTSVPIVTMDGHIAESPAVIVAATLTRADDAVRPGVVQLGLFSAGSQLGVRILVEVPAGDDVLGMIEDFNSRSAQESGQADAIQDTVGHFVIDGATLQATAPSVDYPVQGTHPFVEFLATHMVARTEAIDLSAWLDQPGLPDVEDAFLEAWAQNPYVYVADGSIQGDVIYLVYSYPEGEYQQHQAELKANVEAAVASVISEGMTEQQKAIAINDYLIGLVEYDYNALDVMGQWDYDSSGIGWREFGLANGVLHAWEANGAWDQNLIVCAGYSIANVAMSMEAGLVTVYVSGVVTYNNGRHAWNKVSVDGTWWAVDSTWNDAPSPYTNDYLLIPDSGFTEYATRYEETNWVVDANQYKFATP